MKTVKVFFIIIAGILLITITSCKKENDLSKINVALNLPMTGSFGIYGQTIRDGATLAIEDLKKQDYPFLLNLDFQDNQGNANNTISVMRRQLLSRVDLYVSGVKPQTMAIFDEINKKGVPYFVWVFDAFICRGHENVFRTWVSYKYEPEKYIEYAKKRNAKKVAIVQVNFPHTEEEFTKILIPKLLDMGIQKKDILREVYQWELKDFKDIFAKIKEFSPDLIILNGFQKNLVAMVKALNGYNMIKNGNVIATYDMLDAAPLLTNEEKEGIKLVTPIFNTKNGNKKILLWKSRFQKTFNRIPLYTDAYAYDMIMMIAKAAKNIKFPTSNKKWIKALKSTELDGLTGNLKFDQDGDLIIELDIAVYKNGELEKD